MVSKPQSLRQWQKGGPRLEDPPTVPIQTQVSILPAADVDLDTILDVESPQAAVTYASAAVSDSGMSLIGVDDEGDPAGIAILRKPHAWSLFASIRASQYWHAILVEVMLLTGLVMSFSAGWLTGILVFGGVGIVTGIWVTAADYARSYNRTATPERIT